VKHDRSVYSNDNIRIILHGGTLRMEQTTMKVGTLIKTIRARINLPKGSIGLVTSSHVRDYGSGVVFWHEVKFIGGRRNDTTLRIFERDFEVLHESR